MEYYVHERVMIALAGLIEKPSGSLSSAHKRPSPSTI